MRNLLPANYAVPFVGSPVNDTTAASQGNQPNLCTIDQESSAEPGQPPTGLYRPEPLGGPVYNLDGLPNGLDRAVDAARRFVRGYAPRSEVVGNDCGTASFTCQVNLTCGNLVVSFSLPSAGTADPPVRFYYNSQSTEDSEYGYGWTGLYRQRITLPQSSSSSSWSSSSACASTWLARMNNPAGSQWIINRGDSCCGPVRYIKDPFGRRTEFNYAAGRLSSVKDSVERSTHFQIEGKNLVKVTHPDGRFTVLTYDSKHRLTEWKNPEGDITKFGYDCCRRVVKITTPAGEETIITYPNESTRLLRDARMSVTTLTLDGCDIRTAKNAENIVTTFTWGPLQRITGVEDGRGNDTTFEYEAMDDRSKRIKSITRPIGSYGYSYDKPNGRLVAFLDPNGNNTALAWDASNNRTKVTNAATHVYTYSYNGRNQLTKVENPLTFTTQWTYDGLARRDTVINPENQPVYLTYGAYNQLDSSTNAEGDQTEYTRDQMNRLTVLRDPNTNVTTYTYDRNGRPTDTENALGSHWKSRYDLDGRLIASEDPNHHTVSYGYDPTFDRTRVETHLAFTTTYSYDRAYRLTEVRDPLGHRTTHTYDKSDNQVTTKDAGGHTWTTTYDENDRAVTRVDPLSHTTTYDYDPAGNRTSVTNPLGEPVVTRYDVLHRVTEVVDALENGVANQYDAANRLTKVTDPVGRVTTFAYDKADRQTEVIDPLSNRTTHTYDMAGRRTSTRNPEGQLTQFGYDPGGRMTDTTDPLTHRTAFEYDKADQRVAVVNALGYRFSSVYDAAGLHTESEDPRNNTTFFYYDDDDRLTQTTDAAEFNAYTEYDAASRVTRTIDERGISTTHTYYDDDLLKETTDAGGCLTKYFYDAAHRLTEVRRPLDRLEVYKYDNADRRTEVIDGLANVTTTVYDAAGRVINVIDASGAVTTHTYYDDNQLDTTTDAEGSAVAHFYDGAGRPWKVVRPLSIVTTVGYDRAGRITRSTDGLLRATRTEYDAAGRVTRTFSPKGILNEFTYDAANQRLTHVDGRGQTWSTEYDEAGNVAANVEPSPDGVAPGARTDYAYDSLNRRTESVDSLGRVFGLKYDAVGNITESVNPTGLRTTYTYDGMNRVKSSWIRWVGQTTVTPATFQYDILGNLTKATTRAGQETHYGYDVLNRQTDVENGAHEHARTVYDDKLRKIAKVDGRGKRTTLTHDKVGRPWHVEDPLHHVTTTTYDAAGRPTQTETPLGHKTTYKYDAADQLTETKNPLNKVATTVYDADGRVTRTITPMGFITTYAYDDNNNVIGTQTPGGGFVIVAFDFVNRKTLYADANSKSQKWTYDEAGRELSHEVVNSHTTTYEYDGDDNRTLMIDAALKETTYEYAAPGVLTNQTNPDGSEVVNAVDADGWVLDKDTYRGPTHLHSTLAEKDAAGRLWKQRDDDYTNPASPTTVKSTYTYDEAGNRTLAEAPGQLAGWEYDAANRLIVTGAEGKNVYYEYDANNRITTMTADGGTHVYEYDAANRTTSDTLKVGGVTKYAVSYAYDDDGRQTLQTFPDYTVATKYDPAGNPTEIKMTKTVGGGVQSLTTYVYDLTNRQTNLRSSRLTVTYDDDYQLDGQDRTDVDSWCRMTVDRGTDQWADMPVNDWASMAVDSANYEIETTYDPMGNALVEVTALGVTTSTYDDGNRVLTRKTNGVTTTYVYGGAGNRTTRVSPAGVTTYTWDGAGRLATVTLPGGGVVTYTYDADGLRTSRRSPAGTTKYLWAGNNALEEYDGASGDPTAVHAAQPSGYGNLDSTYDVDAGAAAHYVTDPTGSVVREFTATEPAASLLAYTGFGQIAAAVDATASGGASAADGTAQEQAFAAGFGYWRDPATGLYLARARWYDPVTKQFLSPDPLGSDVTGDANAYRYAGNDPLNQVDPEGLDRAQLGPSAEVGARGSTVSCVTGRTTYLLQPPIWATDERVFWAVEQWHNHKTRVVARVPLGRAQQDLVTFQGAFAGLPRMKMEDLEKAAKKVFEQGRDLSWLPRTAQVQEIRKLILERATQGPVDTIVAAAMRAGLVQPTADRFWRWDNPWAWAAGIGLVGLTLLTAGVATGVISIGTAASAAVTALASSVAVGAALGGVRGLAETYAGSRDRPGGAGWGEYAIGFGLGALFGAVNPVGEFVSSAGALYGGLGELAGGGNFLGRGFQWGGLTGTLAGGFGSAARQALRYGWGRAATAGLRAVGPELAGGAIGAGVAAAYGYDPLHGATWGMMAGGIAKPLAKFGGWLGGRIHARLDWRNYRLSLPSRAYSGFGVPMALPEVHFDPWISLYHGTSRSRAGKILGLGSYGRRRASRGLHPIQGFKEGPRPIFLAEDVEIADEFLFWAAVGSAAGRSTNIRATRIEFQMRQSTRDRLMYWDHVGNTYGAEPMYNDAGNHAIEWIMDKAYEIREFNELLRSGTIKFDFMNFGRR